MSGEVHPKKTLFLRINVGKIENKKTGNKYEVTVNAAGSEPIINSKQSGKWWTISWQELLDMAIDAGIDKKEEL